MPFSTGERGLTIGGHGDAPTPNLRRPAVRTGSGTWSDLSLDALCNLQLGPRAIREAAR